MYPFDIEAYFQKRDVEDTYIVNRFIQRRKKLEEGCASRTRKYFNRDHAAANQRLIDDYLANEPTYDDSMFRRRYRMQKHVFLRIVGDQHQAGASRSGQNQGVRHNATDPRVCG